MLCAYSVTTGGLLSHLSEQLSWNALNATHGKEFLKE